MDEDGVLLSFADDRLSKCLNDYVITSTAFLDIRQQSLVLSEFANKSVEVNVFLFGGFPSAERSVALFVPYYINIDGFEDLTAYFIENPDENPLTVLRVYKDAFSTANHRDYLGSLMGLGIKRETVGDIIVTDFGADIVILKSVAAFLKSEFKSAGRASLKVEEIGFKDICSPKSNISQKVVNVSSMRIDNIISSCYNLSRTESSEAVLSGNVFVNSVQIQKCDKKVNVGDKIVFRSKGKLMLNEITGTSKKGRIFLKIDIYN